MRSCENVIVSVQFQNKSYDMELPAFLMISELTSKIEETLRVMYSGTLPTMGKFTLSCDGHILSGNATLASCGIWDGSTITCNIGGE